MTHTVREIVAFQSELELTPILSRDSHGAVCESFTCPMAVVRAHRSMTVAAQNPRDPGGCELQVTLNRAPDLAALLGENVEL